MKPTGRDIASPFTGERQQIKGGITYPLRRGVSITPVTNAETETTVDGTGTTFRKYPNVGACGPPTVMNFAEGLHLVARWWDDALVFGISRLVSVWCVRESTRWQMVR